MMHCLNEMFIKTIRYRALKTNLVWYCVLSLFQVMKEKEYTIYALLMLIYAITDIRPCMLFRSHNSIRHHKLELNYKSHHNNI